MQNIRFVTANLMINRASGGWGWGRVGWGLEAAGEAAGG